MEMTVLEIGEMSDFLGKNNLPILLAGASCCFAPAIDIKSARINHQPL